MSVRTAQRDDLDAIVGFGSDVIPPYYTPILGEQLAHAQLSWWTAERMAPALAAGHVHVAVTDQEAVVGLCQTGDLAGVHLGPGLPRTSARVQMLQRAIAALPDGTAHVDVEHFAGNQRAAKFYDREGFEVIRTDPGPAGESPNSAIVWRRRPLPWRIDRCRAGVPDSRMEGGYARPTAGISAFGPGAGSASGVRPL